MTRRPIHHTHIATILTIPILVAAQTAVAGKLGDTSSVVNDSSDDDDSSSGWFFCRNRDHDRDHDHDPDDRNHASGTHFPPHEEVDRCYYKHPYAHDNPGLMVVRRKRYSANQMLEYDKTFPANATMTPKKFALMLQSDYHYDWDNVHVGMLRARVLTHTVLGFDARWSSWVEPIKDRKPDIAHQAEFGMHINAASFRKAIARVGAAAQLMTWTANDTTSLGIGGFLGFDYFPHKPFVLSGELLLGALGKSVYVRAETTLGIIVGPVELNVGYRAQLFIATETSDTIKYSGFTGGFRFWF